jgi:hypothetical protein
LRMRLCSTLLACSRLVMVPTTPQVGDKLCRETCSLCSAWLWQMCCTTVLHA